MNFVEHCIIFPRYTTPQIMSVSGHHNEDVFWEYVKFGQLDILGDGFVLKSEGQVILDAIKRNAPGWFERMRVEQAKKREMLSRCIDIACRSDNEGYQDEINGVYNASPFRLSEPDLILLNYICLIKHKEHINDRIVKDDEQIRKWLTVLTRYIDGDSPINSMLDACSRQILYQYRIKNKVGRPKGRGKRTFVYEGAGIQYHPGMCGSAQYFKTRHV